MNFELSNTFLFNIADTFLVFRGPQPKKISEGFTILDKDNTKNSLTFDRSQEIPIRLAKLSWACEIETEEAIYNQGAVIADLLLFHLSGIANSPRNPINTTDQLIETILKWNEKRLEERKEVKDRLYPKTKSDFTIHQINGRDWIEMTWGTLFGTWYYDVFTMINQDILLNVGFHFAGFWDFDKLPDPEHKKLVFESALDFLSHVQIIPPEEVSNHPDLLPPGQYSPHTNEKVIKPEPPEEDSGWSF